MPTYDAKRVLRGRLLARRRIAVARVLSLAAPARLTAGGLSTRHTRHSYVKAPHVNRAKDLIGSPPGQA